MALYRHKMERQRAEVLAMLSHDIRSPLGIIVGYADMLAEELDSQQMIDMPEAKEFSTPHSAHWPLRSLNGHQLP